MCYKNIDILYFAICNFDFRKVLIIYVRLQRVFLRHRGFDRQTLFPEQRDLDRLSESTHRRSSCDFRRAEIPASENSASRGAGYRVQRELVPVGNIAPTPK